MALGFIQTLPDRKIIRRNSSKNSVLLLIFVFTFIEVAGLFALGSQMFSLLVLSIINIGCLFLVAHYGLGNSSSLTIVSVFAFQFLIAAMIKLLIGQPLE